MSADKNRTKIVVVSVLALAALLSSASFRGGALLAPGTTTAVRRDGGSWTTTPSRADDDDDDGDDDGWGDDGVPNAYDGGFLDDDDDNGNDDDDDDDDENTNDDRDGIAHHHDEGDSLSETTRPGGGPDDDNFAGGGTDDDEHRPEDNERRRRRRRVTKDSLPIYLLDTTANRTAVTSWGELAGKWDRTTRYEDLLEMAKTIPSLPPASSTSRRKKTSARRRTVVMIHCGPKTGSTTLRAACRANLRETCGAERSKGRKWFAPPGYTDESVLYPLIRRCVNTTHFCVKDVDMPIDVPAFRDDVALFVHMFPFRDYDGWTTSAMKQQYDRGGTKACERTREFLEECKHNNMEIDFRKYGKARLSVFKDEVVRRMNRFRDERHVFLLYHHLELSDVLGRLSVEYDVPSLPRSDARKKGKRPEGTCDPALLEMFHSREIAFGLADLSTNPEVHERLVKKGGIETLVGLLTTAQDAEAQQFAALAVANTASTKALCNDIVRLNGVVAGLVQYVRNEQGDSIGRQYSAMALGNLLAEPGAHETVVHSDAVAALIVMLKNCCDAREMEVQLDG
ncbi:hypothetical protein ACHAW5_008732 [Stephanodiscus triporus]|uniref:Vacuolar protein 8 n=1 Tax=Stephanodiscus triporus TaxID=2934178 RepID=A0ABD3N914_9STRA